ncbi:MAG: transcription termination factor Rho [Pseudonocardiales bacterium]|nr:transcription termination factor Rho [Pseudonocardiales bacterium]
MTDTYEQTPPAAVDQAGRSAPAGDTNGSKAARPAKRGSLSSMLLPELQQLASGMGISTTKMKKSDLVAAIQAAGGTAAPAGRVAERPSRAANGAAPKADERADEAPRQAESPADEPRQQERQQQPRQQTSEQQAGDQPAGEQHGGEQQGGDQPPRRAEQPQRQGGQNRQSRNDQGGQNRTDQGGQSRNDQGGQSRGEQSRQTNQNQGGGNQGGQNQGGSQNRQGQDGDDDFDGSRRRGRRYRDRRGRNRERVGGGAVGNTDVEPTVSEDDVLVPVAGILDAIEEKNTWFVRTNGYFASSDDIYVANTYVRRFGLRRGDTVTGAVKQSRDGDRREKYNPLVRLDTVNGADPEQSKSRIEFTKLTPLYPQERLRLETEPHILTTRVIDLVMPIGKGQRALIVSPPKAGKTMVLQSIANAIAVNNPEVHLMVVLVDERPEEVTDMQRSVRGEVIASTFDRRPQDHITVAELSIERAKRLVEMGHDVVVLLDSITRLGRAYNLGAPASGRILSGGVDSTALYPPKRFLGAARNIENGGSLTIIATALVETGSAGDTVIFEEFKGTGNAELKLDRKIADKRVFPAIDVDQSSTRKEEILLSPDELAVTIKLRRVLHALESQQAIDLLLDRLKKTRTNLEFLMQIAKTTPGQE